MSPRKWMAVILCGLLMSLAGVVPASAEVTWFQLSDIQWITSGYGGNDCIDMFGFSALINYSLSTPRAHIGLDVHDVDGHLISGGSKDVYATDPVPYRWNPFPWGGGTYIISPVTTLPVIIRVYELQLLSGGFVPNVEEFANYPVLATYVVNPQDMASCPGIPVDYSRLNPELQGEAQAPVFTDGRLNANDSAAAAVIFPQRIYNMHHDDTGEFGIFLVPVARDRSGFLYQAIFN